MRTYITPESTPDRRLTVSRQPFGFISAAVRRASDRDRRLSAQTERIGSWLIVVTSFD